MESPPPRRFFKSPKEVSPDPMLNSPPTSSPAMDALRKRQEKLETNTLKCMSKPIFLPHLPHHHDYLVKLTQSTQDATEELERMLRNFYQSNTLAYWVDDAVDAARLSRMLSRMGDDALLGMRGLWVGVGLAGGRKGLIEVCAGHGGREGFDGPSMRGDEGLGGVNGLRVVVGMLKKPGLSVARVGDLEGVGGYDVVEQWVLSTPVDEGGESVKVPSRLM